MRQQNINVSNFNFFLIYKRTEINVLADHVFTFSAAKEGNVIVDTEVDTREGADECRTLKCSPRTTKPFERHSAAHTDLYTLFLFVTVTIYIGTMFSSMQLTSSHQHKGNTG